jgi:hypothetical protein
MLLKVNQYQQNEPLTSNQGQSKKDHDICL